MEWFVNVVHNSAIGQCFILAFAVFVVIEIIILIMRGKDLTKELRRIRSKLEITEQDIRTINLKIFNYESDSKKSVKIGNIDTTKNSYRRKTNYKKKAYKNKNKLNSSTESVESHNR